MTLENEDEETGQISELEKALNDIGVAESLILCGEQEWPAGEDDKRKIMALGPYLNDFYECIERHESVLRENDKYDLWIKKYQQYKARLEKPEIKCCEKKDEIIPIMSE